MNVLAMPPWKRSSARLEGRSLLKGIVPSCRRTKCKHLRARQNVILELGMLLVRLGRKRVAILHKGSLELPSDITGRV